MDVKLEHWQQLELGTTTGLLGDETLVVPVAVPQQARFDNWAYSDHDKAVLVSFVVILPAAELEGDVDLKDVFEIRADVSSSHSSQLVSVVDLGED